jgi:hypothetical protein
MTTKKFTKLDDILEFKYAETCPGPIVKKMVLIGMIC